MSKVAVTALIQVTRPKFAKIIVSPRPSLTAKYVIESRRLEHVEAGKYLVCKMFYDLASGKRFYRSFNPLTIDTSLSTRDALEKFSEMYGNEVAEQEKIFSIKLGAETKFESATTAISVETPLPAPVTSAGFSDSSFYVMEEEASAFEMAKKLSNGIPTKILVIGASGYGKTSLAKAFAAKNGMDYVRFNTALVRDPEEFFGFRTVEDGDVKFVPSEFTKAIRKGNTVVVLDELNRATPEMANSLFPILDDAAETVVFGENIKVGPGTIIVATVNIGYQFVGTFAIDQALLNRMDITLRVSPLPRDIEVEVLTRRTTIRRQDAQKVVTICNTLRSMTNAGKIVVDASTRTSLRIAKFVASGASFQDAFAWAVVNGADEEERKAIIDAISSSL